MDVRQVRSSVSRYVVAFSALVLLFGSSWASFAAELKLPALISDNMVIQRDTKVPLWGTADPGERVTVTLGDQQRSAVADNRGRWRVELGPFPAGGPHRLTIATARSKVVVKNVLVGEVWVCSGQSNMAFALRGALNAEWEIASATYPKIRLFMVERATADHPLSDVVGQWVECSPQTVPGFSAVAYFFGRELYTTLGVPVGLIESAWGGTPAEAWTSAETLAADPYFKPILDRWAQITANYPKALEQYQKKLEQWKEQAKQARARGKNPPRRPRPPAGGPDDPHRPSVLFNAMIAPLTPYAIRGAIWYQGESNASRAYQYRKLFPAMIQDWRRHWNRGDFPFLFVQLANFMQRKPEPSESAWAELREAQLMALSLPNTAMAVIIDIGEANDIHPKNKQGVGHRLALAARAIVYGEDIEYSGPLFETMTIEGNKVRIRFSHVGGGLVAKGGGPLKGFAIAGVDRKFVWAQAKIEGDSVVVWSEKVPHPVAVRYAWADNPECNLYNKEGLPASPFRTDDWPGVTANAQ